MSERYKFRNPEGIYFTTSTVIDWIDLFTRKELKHIIIDSLKYCQKNKGLIVHAYCIMPSHIHLIISTSGASLESIIRDFKKFTSREIIKAIKEINESRKDWLLKAMKKKGEPLKRIQNYKVWKDGNHPIELFSNHLIDQKLEYLHQNPVEAEIVTEPEHYLYSSCRDYAGGKGLLEVDFLD